MLLHLHGSNGKLRLGASCRRVVVLALPQDVQMIRPPAFLRFPRTGPRLLERMATRKVSGVPLRNSELQFDQRQ
jgi:hypothetical protein